MSELAWQPTNSWQGASLSDVVARALAGLIDADPDDTVEGAGERETFTVVFSGEAESTEAAFRAALEDLAIQCTDHNGKPIQIGLDGLMATDQGVRIWGSVACVPFDEDPWQKPRISAITIQQERDDSWTLTIVRA